MRYRFSASLLIALLMAGAWATARQDATKRLTIDVPVPVYRAAVQRVGEKADPALTKAAVEAWAIKRLTDDLTQELTAQRLATAEKVEADDSALSTLTADQCAAITKILGKPLKRCFG